MKNIRSSKSQDGFIGEILGFIVGAVILYVVIVTIMFVVGFTLVAKEGKETREYRATFTDTEWIVKEEYEFAQRSIAAKTQTAGMIHSSVVGQKHNGQQHHQQ